jgi:ATP-binding cassette subfamily F protein 2
MGLSEREKAAKKKAEERKKQALLEKAKARKGLPTGDDDDDGDRDGDRDGDGNGNGNGNGSDDGDDDGNGNEGEDGDSPGADGQEGGPSSSAARPDQKKKKKAGQEVKVGNLKEKLAELAMDDSSNRAVTGVLASHPQGRDIHISGYSLSYFGQVLVEDQSIELNYGRRYGLLGYNGCGKSTFLKSLSTREVPIPKHIDIFHLDGEARASDLTALEAVLENVNAEREFLEKEMEVAMTDEDQAAYVEELSERLDELDPSVVDARAGKILFGLGFTKQMQAKKTRDFSGGWRMRIALAKALFVSPALLILDEPTNHLDLSACVWLENYLKSYKRCLVVVSHSQDFLNGVCTNIIHLYNRRLVYYTGDFDTYVRTRRELEENQTKRYEKEQAEIAHMKEYIARFGHGSAKLAKQAQSKEKTMARMIEGGLTEAVTSERHFTFSFPLTDKLPPPVLQFVDVSFGYHPGKEHELYNKLDIGFDQDTRIGLVGPNGIGKSTLLKLITGDNIPTEGAVRRHSKLRLGFYHQHLVDILTPSMCPLEWMMKTFPDRLKEEEDARRQLGRFGTSGKAQTQIMATLSDGQRCRIAFAWLAMMNAHILLLDEPTNHLDIETIDSLAKALNSWNGGVILVSHDFRLIEQVVKDIYVAENKTLKRWNGNIRDYKKKLAADMGL